MSIKSKINQVAIILRAIQNAKEKDPENYYTKLFITEENSLIKFDYDELVKTVSQLDKDRLIEINHLPKHTAVLADNRPHNKVFPMNYFSIHVTDNFDEVVRKYGIAPLDLLSLIPPGKKYKDIRKIAELLVDKGTANNFHIARRLFRVEKRRLKIREYSSDRIRWNQRIENKLRTLKKLLQNSKYSVAFEKDETRLIEPPPPELP